MPTATPSSSASGSARAATRWTSSAGTSPPAAATATSTATGDMDVSASTAPSTPSATTTSRSRPSSSRARPTRSPSSSCASSTSATVAAGCEGRSIGRTVEGRDMMVESGMEKGMAEGYERLDELVAQPHVRARPGAGMSAMDWTLEVVIVPVSDLGAADRLLPGPGRLRPRPRHAERAHARRAAHPARVRLLDRRRGPALAEGDGARVAARHPARRRRRRRRRGRSWSAGASSAREIQVIDPRDGGTFFGFSDPDGNSWAVQQLQARADKPLIPHEARGRFGEDLEP